MKKEKISISDNIRMLREKQNYSQDFIASRLNVSQQAYSIIEKNPEKTSLKNLREIAKILNVSISTLLLEDDCFIQQNFNHQYCNIASQQHISSDEVYKKLVQKLESEISFLRSILENQNFKVNEISEK